MARKGLISSARWLAISLAPVCFWKGNASAAIGAARAVRDEQYREAAPAVKLGLSLRGGAAPTMGGRRRGMLPRGLRGTMPRLRMRAWPTMMVDLRATTPYPGWAAVGAACCRGGCAARWFSRNSFFNNRIEDEF